MLLTNNVIGQVKGSFKGSLGTMVRYTPENNFEIGYNIFLSNGFNAGHKDLDFNLGITSFSPREWQINFPFTTGSLEIPFYIGSASIKTKTPLLDIPGIDLGQLTLGSVQVNYSPYTVAMTRASANRTAQRNGITLENAVLNNLRLNSFLVWVDDMRSPFYGAKLENFNSKFKITGVFSQFLNYTETGVPEKEESVKSVELNFPFKKGNISALLVCQKQLQNQKDIKQVTYSSTLNNDLRYNISWKDFTPGFRPLFSDRTIKFDTVSGYPRGWNPIDEYSGQLGLSATISGKIQGNNIRLSAQEYIDRDYFRDLTLIDAQILGYELFMSGTMFGFNEELSFSRQQKQITNGLLAGNVYNSLSAWGNFSKIVPFDLILLTGNLLCWYDDGTELIDNDGTLAGIVSEKGMELALSSKIRKGMFRGLSLYTGVKYISPYDSDPTLYKSVGLDYRSKSGVNILVRKTTPNFEEPNFYLRLPSGRRAKYRVAQYDRFGKRVLLDNIIEITYSMSF